MPCDYSRYPSDWRAIRAEVLERAGHRCEGCGVENYSRGARSETNGKWYTQRHMDGMNANEGWWHWPNGYPKVIGIVLTISHTDHDITNNGEPGNRPNLRALCQRCHNRHDAEYRRGNAKATMKRKRGMKELFET